MEISNKLLKVMIPSETVRSFAEGANWYFSDRQIASLIYHSKALKSIKDKYELLKDLRDQTTDQLLKDQLSEYLFGTSESILSRLQDIEKSSDSYVYVLFVLKDADTAEMKIYKDYISAYNIGKASGSMFRIARHKILDMSTNADDVLLATYDDSGELTQLHDSKSYFNKYFKNSKCCRFETEFYCVPNPFDRGDIVRIYDSNKVGVVATKASDWDTRISDILDSDENVDETGCWINVDILQEDGTFTTEHICPVNLELYSIDRNTREFVKHKVLMELSNLYKGEGSIEFLLHRLDEYNKNNIDFTW